MLAKRTQAEDVPGGLTIDQIVAGRIGQDTPFPSLELATADFTGYVGACTSGYSCVYTNTISWSTPTTPLPMEINPRVVFERLFGRPGTPAQRAARMQRNLSILDLVTQQAADLQRGLGTRDRARLSEYLDNIREIERRIERAEGHTSPEVASFELPVGMPESFEEHLALMYDLLTVAYQADLTRVFTFMTDRELSQRTYPQIGVTEQHHTVSHHGNDPDNIAKVATINTYHVDAVREVPGQAAGHAGRRRLAARSLADRLRRRHGQSQPARQRSAAAAGGGRRPRDGQSAHQARSHGRPSATCGCRSANHFGSPIDTLGESNGRVELFTELRLRSKNLELWNREP